MEKVTIKKEVLPCLMVALFVKKIFIRLGRKRGPSFIKEMGYVQIFENLY